MKHNKIGTIFFVSILALAGIGISYAGFTDYISVYGTVDTATVDLVVADYSGTDVWKVYGPTAPDGEIVKWYGFVSDPERPTKESLEKQYTGCTAILVASSWASEGTDYDVDMVWDNIFPCIDFKADVIIHYIGSIPAHVTISDLVWDDTTGYYDFSQYTTLEVYQYTLVNDEWIKGKIITLPVQMHYCQYIGVEVTIHIAQDNTLQDKHGEFSFNINAIQWNDPCDDGGGTGPGSNTAWARMNDDSDDFTYEFPGSSWATYIIVEPTDAVQTFYLYAGQFYKVGELNIWKSNDKLYVQYDLDDGFDMEESQLHIATTLDGIPHAGNGNPIPGNFDYKTLYNPYEQSDTYEIDWDTSWDGIDLYIAAHSVVWGYY